MDRACHQCGDQYEIWLPRQHRQKYCSSRCADDATNDRNRKGPKVERRPKSPEVAAAILAFKSRPCHRCGELHPPRVMDCHHRDPSTKSFAISYSATLSRPLPVVLAELAKCDLLCANCHRYAH